MADEPNPNPTPSPTPAAAAPAAEPARGISAMVAELSGDTGTPPPATKPDKAPAAAPEPKPDAKTPVSEPKPTAEPDAVGEGLWKTAPKHLKNDHYKFKRETETKISGYEAKIKELEGKSVQSPADLKRIKDLEERSAQLEKDLSDREDRLKQADYSKSDEFKRNYVDKGTRAYNKAVADVKALKVTVTDADGNEIERPATQADFDAIRKLDPYEQDRKLDEMFGPSAKRVALHINLLNSIEEEANEAITSAREKSAAKEKEQAELNQKQGAEFETHSKTAMDELVKSHPMYFAPDETNPEASKALEGGMKFVEDAAKNANSMSPKQYAETTVILKALAGAAPRLMVEGRQKDAKIKGLEDELAKYRKSSPGAASPGSSGAPVVKEERGIEAAVRASVKQV